MTTEQTAPTKLIGSDDELRAILERDEVLVCTRDWSAWSYRTMSDNDFVGYTDEWDNPESGVAEIRAWRDAAVEAFRAALVAALRGAESQTMGLGPGSGDWLGAMADFVADFEPKD